MFRRLLISFICLSILVPLVGIQNAKAISFSPSRIELQADPGDSFTESFVLYNNTDETLNLIPEVADFTSADDEKGIPDFDTPDDYPYGLKNWVSFDFESVTLEPNESQEINYTFTVPEDAVPGGHYGAILFPTSSNAVDTEVEGADEEGEVAIKGLTGPLLVMLVSGDVLETANLLEFSRDKKWYSSLPVNMFTRLQNTGTVHLKPVGFIYVRDMFGRTVAILNVNEVGGNVLPESIRRFDNTWVKSQLDEETPEIIKELRNFGIGKYTAQLTISYGSGNHSTDLFQSFWVIPWQLILGLVVLLLILVGFFKLYNRSVVKHTVKTMENKQTKK